MTLQKLVEVVRKYKKGNREVMIYYYIETGEWCVDVGIPSVRVMLGEVEGDVRVLVEGSLKKNRRLQMISKFFFFFFFATEKLL